MFNKSKGNTFRLSVKSQMRKEIIGNGLYFTVRNVVTELVVRVN